LGEFVGYLLRAVFLTTEEAQSFVFGEKKRWVGLRFGRFFSQTHPVTLF
jgi:regulator of protease activity HflC (stomatin/prohibitin superfamily)